MEFRVHSGCYLTPNNPKLLLELIAPQALYVQLPKTHAVSEKRCSPADALYAVLGSGRGMCRQIRYQRKFLGYVSTWKGNQKFFYERHGTGGGSTRSISVATNSKMDDFATIRKSLMRPLYSPEIDQGCTMRVSWLVSVLWNVAGRSELHKPEFLTV